MNLEQETYQRAKEWLSKKGNTQMKLHKESGAPFYWIRDFVSYEPKETGPGPGVRHVQKLYDYLKEDE